MFLSMYVRTEENNQFQAGVVAVPFEDEDGEFSHTDIVAVSPTTKDAWQVLAKRENGSHLGNVIDQEIESRNGDPGEGFVSA